MTNANHGQQILVHEIAKIKRITDKLGLPIDPEILPAVAAFRHRGFNTISSCAGHLDRSTGGPYIVFKSPDVPLFEEKLQTLDLKSDEFRAIRDGPGDRTESGPCESCVMPEVGRDPYAEPRAR